jgi:hypothetical protein
MCVSMRKGTPNLVLRQVELGINVIFTVQLSGQTKLHAKRPDQWQAYHTLYLPSYFPTSELYLGFGVGI